MKTRFLSCLTVVSLGFSISFNSAYAGEQEDALIAKVVAAYGGDAFINLSNIKIEGSYLSPTIGQSHAAGKTEINKSKQVLLLNLKDNKFIFDALNHGRGGSFQGLTIGNGESAYTVNLNAMTYGDARSADPYSIVGGVMRTSDTVLAFELNKNKDKAKLLEKQNYLNRVHHVLSLPFPQSPDLNLYIDSQTNLITKMVRMNPQLGALDYIFSGHESSNGIMSATSVLFSIAGNPQLISNKYSLSFNVPVDENEFSLPDGLKKEGDRIDASNGIVNKISDRVYHIGRDGGYSLFVDTNVGVVAAGGYAALTQRFKEFQAESGVYKPLAYQVITHHHADHVGGVSEAVALGAKLVTVEENIEAIQGSSNPAPKARDFYSMDSRVSFGEGKNRVEVYEVSTIHAASFLVLYVPSTKTVFIADHFGSAFAKTIPDADQDSVDMLNALEALDIDIQKIATAHNPRIFTMAEMRKSVANFTPSICAGKRPVCS